MDASVSTALATVQPLLNRLLGPATEEIGLLLGESVRAWRLERSVKLLARVQRTLLDAGIDPQQVPMKTFVPLLEGATVEQDDDLFERWAALLANAAAGESGAPVHPIYVSILSRLQPLDAKILRLYYDNLIKNFSGFSAQPMMWPGARVSISANKLVNFYKLPGGEAFESLYTLASLGLLVREPADQDQSRSASLWLEDKFQLSPMGYRFIQACEPPKRAAAPDEAP